MALILNISGLEKHVKEGNKINRISCRQYCNSSKNSVRSVVKAQNSTSHWKLFRFVPQRVISMEVAAQELKRETPFPLPADFFWPRKH